MRKEGSALTTIKPFKAFLEVPSKETWSKERLQLLTVFFFSWSQEHRKGISCFFFEFFFERISKITLSADTS